jgi:hypothetical protein
VELHQVRTRRQVVADQAIADTAHTFHLLQLEDLSTSYVLAKNPFTKLQSMCCVYF